MLKPISFILKNIINLMKKRNIYEKNNLNFICTFIFVIVCMLQVVDRCYPNYQKEVNGIPTASLTVEDAKNFGLADTIKFYLPEKYDKEEVKTFLKNYYKDQISAEVIDYIIDTASEETAN